MTLTDGSLVYSVVGFANYYPFFYCPKSLSNLNETMSRVRISQFLILPPFQGQGHGSVLYTKLCQDLSFRKDVVEITGFYYFSRF